MGRERWAGERGFLLLVWALPFHVFVMALLFGGLGWSSGLVRTLASWKEVAVLLLGVHAMVVLARAPWRRPLALADLGALLVCALVLIRGSVEWALPNWSTTVTTQLYGARDLALGFLLYLVGRSTPELLSSPRVTRALIGVGLVTSLIALVERVLLPPEGLVLLGVPAYYSEFLGLEALTDPDLYGLPFFYFTDFGAEALRRAGSVYLSPQAFAMSFLLVLPAAQILAMDGDTTTPGFRRWGVLGMLWLGLLLSVTRMTIIACLVQALVLLLIRRRTAAVGALGALALAVTTVGIIFSSGLRDFVWRTLTFSTGSSASHIEDWSDGIIAMFDFPLGAGLATADATAVRAGRAPLTADNLFLKYGVELGFPGLFAFLVFIGGVLGAALWLSRHGRRPAERSAALLVVAITVGVLVNGMTAVVTGMTMLTYLWSWLSGSVVTRVAEQRAPRAVPVAGLAPAPTGAR